MLRTTAIAKELATIERKMQETENATLKEALKKKQARLKAELKDPGQSTAKLAKTLLAQREVVKQLSKVEFNDLIRRLSKKPEYSFLKTMPKSTVKNDLEVTAKPVGWRFKGRGNYDKPTKAEIIKGKKNGTVYREVRPRRSDVSQVVRLKEGGDIVMHKGKKYIVCWREGNNKWVIDGDSLLTKIEANKKQKELKKEFYGQPVTVQVYDFIVFYNKIWRGGIFPNVSKPEKVLKLHTDYEKTVSKMSDGGGVDSIEPTGYKQNDAVEYGKKLIDAGVKYSAVRNKIEEHYAGLRGEIQDVMNKVLDYKESKMSNGGSMYAGGGEVVGYLKSKKPVYEETMHSSHSDFTPQEHREAAKLLRKKVAHENPSLSKPLSELSEKYRKYSDSAWEHEKWAESMKEKTTNFAHGGSLEQESVEMINNQATSAKHHIEELKEVLSHQKHIEPWVIAKMQRATTDLSDITHYLDGKDPKMMHGGGIKAGDTIRLKNDLPYMASLASLQGKDLEVVDVKEVYFASGPKKFYHVMFDGDKHEINEDFVDHGNKMMARGSRLNDNIPSTEDMIALVASEREKKINEWQKLEKVVIGRNDGYSWEDGTTNDNREVAIKPSRAKILEIIKNNPNATEIHFYGTIKVGQRVGQELEIVDGFDVVLWSKEDTLFKKGFKFRTDNGKYLNTIIDKSETVEYKNSKDNREFIYYESIDKYGNIGQGRIHREVLQEDLENGDAVAIKKMMTGGSIEVGDKVKASKEYGGKSGTVIEKRGSFVVVEDSKGKTESYHESDLIKKMARGGCMYADGGSIEVGDSVSYTRKLTGVKTKGSVIEIDEDEKYVKVRNSVGNIDYIPASEIKKMSNGGAMYAKGGRIDLFEDYENIPPNIQEILDFYEDDFQDGRYDGLSKALKEVEANGYTFEYYLDGEAYGLRPKNVPLNHIKGYEDEEYSKGGGVDKSIRFDKQALMGKLKEKLEIANRAIDKWGEPYQNKKFKVEEAIKSKKVTSDIFNIQGDSPKDNYAIFQNDNAYLLATELAKVIKKYKKYETKTTSTGAASGWSGTAESTVSGFIRGVVNHNSSGGYYGQNRNYLIAIQIGGGIDSLIRKKIEEEVFPLFYMLDEYNSSDGGVCLSVSNGTNYDIIGLTCSEYSFNESAANKLREILNGNDKMAKGGMADCGWKHKSK